MFSLEYIEMDMVFMEALCEVCKKKPACLVVPKKIVWNQSTGRALRKEGKLLVCRSCIWDWLYEQVGPPPEKVEQNMVITLKR